jgi:PTH1 family peptidyl-tRNA hydrolase
MSENILLIVGLGNPGKEFENTRHNAGFLFIDYLKDNFDFSEWEFKKNMNADISQGRISDKKIILVKPQTFMNNSGLAVKKAATFFKIPVENIWVVHDDIDIPMGEMKISKSRGSAGHKGIESIISYFKTKDFIRFRIGIKPKTVLNQIKKEKFVLDKFNISESKKLKSLQKDFIKVIELATDKGIVVAMNEIN